MEWRTLWNVALWLLLLAVIDVWISLAATCPGPGQCSISSGPVFRGLGPVMRFFEDPNRVIAIFTIILALSTIALWRSTRNLWRVTDATLQHAKDTAQRELRAYIGHEPMGAHFESTGFTVVNNVPVSGNQKGGVKYFEKNFGQTPATDVTMHVCIIPGSDPPLTFDGPFEQIPVMPTVAPGQNIGKVIDPTWKREQSFFLYGYIDYSDVFGNEYRRRFAFGHDPERMKRGNDEWIAHSEHNDELRR